MHDVQNEALFVGHIYAPIVVSPDFRGMLLEEFTDKLRDLNPQGCQAGALDLECLPDTFLGT
jgi:hypothetical protein